MPKVELKNIRGRIFRAQVKKVEKDKIQVHLIDIDKKYDDKSTILQFGFHFPRPIQARTAPAGTLCSKLMIMSE